jgi:uncharacterized protein (TIGR02246 family)
MTVIDKAISEPFTAAADVLSEFSAAISRGNPRAAAACFTRDGCLITPGGTVVHGREEIAGLVAQLVDSCTEIDIDRLVVRRAGDVALAEGHLTMRSNGPARSRFARSCEATMALHMVDDSWKLAVLAPWSRD